MDKYLIKNDDGVYIADTLAIRGDVEAMYKSIFGDQIDTRPQSTVGMLIDQDTLIISTNLQNLALNLNQVLNINLSSGTQLDAIAYNLGIKRKDEQFTVVDVALTGISGAIVPAGSLAKDTNGNIFRSLSNYTIPSSGKFQAVESGPISVKANTLTDIVTVIAGWETINNPTDANVIGSDKETDQQLRDRLNKSQSNNTSGTYLSIIPKIISITGVVDCKMLHNPTGQQVVKEGITLLPHSTWLTVLGGDDADIAEAYFLQKFSGDYNGQVVVDYKGTSVKFDRPTPVNPTVTVTVSSGNEDDIKQSIVKFSDTTLKINYDIIIFEIASFVSSALGIKIYDLKLNGSLSDISIGANQYGQIRLQDITVVYR